MLTIYKGEQKSGRIKFTSDRDCLAPDIVRFEVLYFPSMVELLQQVHMLEFRGFEVCVDTEEFFYETSEAA